MRKQHFPQRDHGYGDAPIPKGPPRIIGKLPSTEACPNCGCSPVFGIEVTLRDAPPQLRRSDKPHEIIGTYVGCAACPWASAMVSTIRETTDDQPATMKPN